MKLWKNKLPNPQQTARHKIDSNNYPHRTMSKSRMQDAASQAKGRKAQIDRHGASSTTHVFSLRRHIARSHSAVNNCNNWAVLRNALNLQSGPETAANETNPLSTQIV